MRNNILSIAFITCLSLLAFSNTSKARHKHPIRTKKVVVVKRGPVVKRVAVKRTLRPNVLFVKPVTRTRIVKTKVVKRSPFVHKRKVIIRRR